jgi:hypothetical protein
MSVCSILPNVTMILHWSNVWTMRYIFSMMSCTDSITDVQMSGQLRTSRICFLALPAITAAWVIIRYVASHTLDNTRENNTQALALFHPTTCNYFWWLQVNIFVASTRLRAATVKARVRSWNVFHVCFGMLPRLVWHGTVVGSVCGDGGNPFSEPYLPCRRRYLCGASSTQYTLSQSEYHMSGPSLVYSRVCSDKKAFIKLF